MRDPACTCPPNVQARDVLCPTHGVHPVLSTAQAQRFECLHTIVEHQSGAGWHCVACGAPASP